MTNSRNGKSLLGRGGGEQRSGAAEEYFFQPSTVQLSKKLPAEGYGAAAAAGAAGMDILEQCVKNQGSAVLQFTAQIHPFIPGQLQQCLLSHQAKIPGDDQIKILRTGVKILEMGPNGTQGCRSHCRTHIVGILDTQVHYGADGAAFSAAPEPVTVHWAVGVRWPP